MSLSSFETLLDRLGDRLEETLPGHEAHRSMAPRLSERRAALSVEDRECREAGVLVLLLDGDDGPTLVLTVRHRELPDHGGQVSFPGGQQEGTESLSNTALRESAEEIGLPPASTRLLGALTPLYIPPSNFCVHPFVGGASGPLDLRPTDREVETILRPRIRYLLSPRAQVTETWTLHGRDVDVPYYDVEGHAVWGATAMMLAEVLAVVADVLEE